jgi:WXXGXW repeat (2 copies)
MLVEVTYMRRIHWIGFVFLAVVMMAMPSGSSAQIAVGVSIHIAPPVLPVYVQPVCPGAGYIWTPGYWAYGVEGYYWVPGTWVLAPRPGFLWTPGYWGWAGGAYLWHAGYWGPHVGFYGGVNYGFGYGGVGFVGGRWSGGVFVYNTAVTHVDTTVIHNTYVDRTVVRETTVNRVSFNGGEGGIKAEPTAAERSAEHDEHISATHEQTEHEHAASTNRAQLASVNHGRPPVAASGKAGDFSSKSAVSARGATPANAGRSEEAKPAASTARESKAGEKGGQERSSAQSSKKNSNSSKGAHKEKESSEKPRGGRGR